VLKKSKMEGSCEELQEMARREEVVKGFKSKSKDTFEELERLLHEGKLNQEVTVWYWMGVMCTEEEYNELEKRYQELTIKETGKACTEQTLSQN